MKSRLARLADAPGVAAVHLVRGLVQLGETKLGAVLMRLSPATARELARRQRERPREGERWFTADESALVEVLADLIVPSDDTGPGAGQLKLAGRSAAERLDHLAAGSPRRQALYGPGLLALDRLAQDKHKARFVALSHEQQVQLLQVVDRLRQSWSAPSSLAAKIKNRIAVLYHKWSGVFPAVELFPGLVQDVLQAFYTDRLSWAWLDYDGPPMPNGYRNVLASRAPLPDTGTPS